MVNDGPSQLPIEGVIDLHTFQPKDIKDLLPAYIEECRRRDIREIRIIHGKGIGTLREIVHAVLARMPEVDSFRLADESAGSWGATVVLLRPIDRITGFAE